MYGTVSCRRTCLIIFCFVIFTVFQMAEGDINGANDWTVCVYGCTHSVTVERLNIRHSVTMPAQCMTLLQELPKSCDKNSTSFQMLCCEWNACMFATISSLCSEHIDYLNWFDDRQEMFKHYCYR